MSDNLTNKLFFLPQAMEIAAKCWALPKTAALPMQPEVAEAFANVLAEHMNTAAQGQRDACFYKEINDRIARALGHDPAVLDASELPAILAEQSVYILAVEGRLAHAEEIAEARRVGANNLNAKYIEAVALLTEADHAMAPIELRQRITDFVAKTTPYAEKYK